MKASRRQRYETFLLCAVVSAALINPAGAVAPSLQGSSFLSTTNTDSPILIPTGPAVVTSTITISGAQHFIVDLDVQTFITHAFPADLDITITSPAGTVVTLTTDNGAGNDNIFNGTVWDDQSNPGSALPYTTNEGLVAEHSYINLLVASPLVPEEPLSAFNGEDPNGTWTLTVADDLAGDGGSIDSWTLDLTTLPAPIVLPAPAHFATSPALAIPNFGEITAGLAVSGIGTFLFDVNITVDISHTFPDDLDITLTSPAGTVVTLTTDNGDGNDNIFAETTWDDNADPGGPVPTDANQMFTTEHSYQNLTVVPLLIPEEALGAFIGEDPNGTWTLTIDDDLAGDSGMLNSWSLDIVAKSPVLKVTKPQKDQQVKRNRNLKVIWKTEGNVGDKVGIELWKNGIFASTLEAMTKDDGKQKVKIPGDAVLGGGYQVRVNSLTTTTESLSKKFRIINP